jgi:hypothetical protein
MPPKDRLKLIGFSMVCGGIALAGFGARLSAMHTAAKATIMQYLD